MLLRCDFCRMAFSEDRLAINCQWSIGGCQKNDCKNFDFCKRYFKDFSGLILCAKCLREKKSEPESIKIPEEEENFEDASEVIAVSVRCDVCHRRVSGSKIAVQCKAMRGKKEKGCGFEECGAYKVCRNFFGAKIGGLNLCVLCFNKLLKKED